MTYTTILQHQNRYKKIAYLIGILIIVHTLYMSVIASLLAGAYGYLLILLMNAEKKKKNYTISPDEEVIFYNKRKFYERNVHPNQVTMIVFPIVAMLYMMVDTVSDSSEFIMNLLIMGILASLLLITIRIIMAYEFVVLDDGVLVDGIFYKFDSLRKYQFIKKKKSGYLVELSIGKRYTSINMTDELCQSFKAYLEDKRESLKNQEVTK